MSKERHEILHKLRQARSTESETFRTIFEGVYQPARGAQAAEVIVLADGARWLWHRGEEIAPQAVQILDFSHVKHSLWEAAKLIYGPGSGFLAPWVKEHATLLLEDKVEQGMAHLRPFLD